MKTVKCYRTHLNCNDNFCLIEVNKLSREVYGKPYHHLPDDGAEQDCIMGIYTSKIGAESR